MTRADTDGLAAYGQHALIFQEFFTVQVETSQIQICSSIGMLQLFQLCRTRSFSSCPSAVPCTLFRRAMSATSARSDPFRPAKRVAGHKQDVWYAKPDVFEANC